MEISIHALLAESDSECPHTRQRDVISIHALLAESDARRPGQTAKADRFLSTLSLRRATRGKVTDGYDRNDFYPRSPCGERRFSCYLDNIEISISIHALLAESDGCNPDFEGNIDAISIHALLAESDAISFSA